MTAVSLTNTISGTFTFTDGEVESIRSDITATPDADPMPGSAPTGVLIIDFNGSKKNINIIGKLVGANVAAILTRKQNLEKFVNGNQTLTTFTSNYESNSFNGSSFSTTRGVVTRIGFTEVTGNPNILEFNLSFVVGS